MIASRVQIVLKVRLVVITNLIEYILLAIGPDFTNRLSYGGPRINIIGDVKISLDQNKGSNNKFIVDNLFQTSLVMFIFGGQIHRNISLLFSTYSFFL